MNPTRPTPKVGDTLYSLNIGNAAKNRPQVLTPVQVVKVGRLYFTCAHPELIAYPHAHIEYHLNDWRERTRYDRESQLFTNAQEYEEMFVAEEIREELNRVFLSRFNAGKIPLAALRQIRGIVEVYTGLAAKN